MGKLGKFEKDIKKLGWQSLPNPDEDTRAFGHAKLGITSILCFTTRDGKECQWLSVANGHGETSKADVVQAMLAFMPSGCHEIERHENTFNIYRRVIKRCITSENGQKKALIKADTSSIEAGIKSSTSTHHGETKSKESPHKTQR